LRLRSYTILAVILAFLLTLLSLARSEHFPLPDLAYTKHGFPIFWLTHQTSAFSGPVDWWLFDYWGLTINLIFWFCIALLSLWILGKTKWKIKA